ncbi:MAG: trehalose-phosphatase [Nocardioides sp.]
MEFTSADGPSKYEALVAVASDTVVALDFDGTLAPIVDDPEKARIHPDAGEVLADLAEHVAAVAVVTGRPVRQVLDLGGLEEVGDALMAAGKQLYVFGQYGNQRWTATRRAVIGPRPPAGLASFMRELPRALRDADAAEAWVEDKGLALAIHTRRMSDPAGAYSRLLPVLRRMAQGNNLMLEPGRNVLEVRSPGMNKGVVVDKLVEELGAKGFVFAGDDLGDVEAFESVAARGKDGMSTLLVCSASDEESALMPLADVVVPGPDGVLGFLRQFSVDVTAS